MFVLLKTPYTLKNNNNKKDEANPQRQKEKWGPGAGGSEGWGVTDKEYWASFGGDKNILKVCSGDEYMTF